MSRFSQHLIKKRLLTPAQLEEALQHQAVYGARLGTNLVELRMIRVDQLAECLAEFHRVPLPPRPWLERPKRAAIERVTKPLVERIRFIPLRLETNVLHAAVLDPNDPRTLDDLRFATGCRIQPYVLPEIWMHDWLLALFKMPRGIRHVETDVEPERELNEPAQDFDFQAAQAALAAKAARIMVPATVGVVEGAAKPGEDNVMRKTLQGELRSPFADGRMSIPGEARPTMQGAMRPALQGEARITAQGDPRVEAARPINPLRGTNDPVVPGQPRPTLQGAMRKTLTGEARITHPGEGRAPGERSTLTGEQRVSIPGRMPGAPPDPRMFLGPAGAAAPSGATVEMRVSPPFEGRASVPEGMRPIAPVPVPSASSGTPMNPLLPPAEARTTAQGTERVNLSELGGPVIERPPSSRPRSSGSSVRPPPVSMRSLTELGGRTSVAHAPIYSAPANAQNLELSVPWDDTTGQLAQPVPPAQPGPPAAQPSQPATKSKTLELDPGPALPPAAEPSLPPTAAASVRPAKPRELTDIETALRQVPDREQLIDLSFEIASRFARVVALFIVHRGTVQGVRCVEDGVTRSLSGVLVPLESVSMLSQAANQSVPFRVDPSVRTLDARIHRLITEQNASEVGLFPVVVKTRAVNLLYASHGSEPLGTIAFGALSMLATEMGAAYGQLILHRKGGVVGGSQSTG